MKAPKRRHRMHRCRRIFLDARPRGGLWCRHFRRTNGSELNEGQNTACISQKIVCQRVSRRSDKVSGSLRQTAILEVREIGAMRAPSKGKVKYENDTECRRIANGQPKLRFDSDWPLKNKISKTEVLILLAEPLNAVGHPAIRAPEKEALSDRETFKETLVAPDAKCPILGNYR
jgi:hypothetical protein